MSQKSLDLKTDPCFQIDSFIEDADQTIWMADLSDGRTAYRDDGRPGYIYSSWDRLREYCLENNLYVKGMTLKFRSHLEMIPQSEAYFVRNSILGSFGKKKTVNRHYFLVGTLQKEVLLVQKWQVPELLLISTKEREINDDTIRSMIWKPSIDLPLLGIAQQPLST